MLDGIPPLQSDKKVTRLNSAMIAKQRAKTSIPFYSGVLTSWSVLFDYVTVYDVIEKVLE